MAERNPTNLKLIVYGDLLSQPVRSVVAFCKVNGIEYEWKETPFTQMAHRSEEFTAINPLQELPVIQEVDEQTGETFTLTQSPAIMRYLAQSRGVPDHWYPADLRKRALVDSYLDMHHAYLRKGMKELYHNLLSAMFYKKPPSVDVHEEKKAALEKAMADLERRLAANAFLCGPEISIADLLAAHEVENSKWFGLTLSRYPNTNAWFDRVINDDPVQVELCQGARAFSKMCTDFIAAEPRIPKDF